MTNVAEVGKAKNVQNEVAKKRITIERTFQAPVEDVWELWTTKEGIESWWGPDGFTTKVYELDLRPKGKLHYAMTATGPEQIDFMKKNGMPLTNHTRGWYEEIVPLARLGFWQIADFVPGVAAYDVDTVVEIATVAGGVRMVVTVDAMHDAHWTEMARQGWESQLDKAVRLLAARET